MGHFEFAEPALRDEALLMIRAQIRRYVDERIAPNGDAWEAAGEFPREVFRELGALGLLGMRHPVEYGGGGLGALSSVILAEELARSSYGGVASSLTVHTDMSISHIAHRGAEAQKQRYLPAACAGELVGAVCVTEPDAGSDVAGLKTRATRTKNGWVLNGAKTYITNGVLGDIYIVAARTDGKAPARAASRCSSSSAERPASASAASSASTAGAVQTLPSCSSTMRWFRPMRCSAKRGEASTTS